MDWKGRFRSINPKEEKGVFFLANEIVFAISVSTKKRKIGYFFGCFFYLLHQKLLQKKSFFQRVYYFKIFPFEKESSNYSPKKDLKGGI
jgi:hypothetical protein